MGDFADECLPESVDTKKQADKVATELAYESTESSYLNLDSQSIEKTDHTQESKVAKDIEEKLEVDSLDVKSKSPSPDPSDKISEKSDEIQTTISKSSTTKTGGGEHSRLDDDLPKEMKMNGFSSTDEHEEDDEKICDKSKISELCDKKLKESVVEVENIKAVNIDGGFEKKTVEKGEEIIETKTIIDESKVIEKVIISSSISVASKDPAGILTEISKIVELEEESKKRQSISDIPDISVDSPIKGPGKLHTSSPLSQTLMHTLFLIAGKACDRKVSDFTDASLSTENLSPSQNLSGRSTPEIKIDFDVDRHSSFPRHYDEEYYDEHEPIDISEPGPSRDDISGKSTPDIAEMSDQYKAGELSGKATPPTVPVSPIVLKDDSKEQNFYFTTKSSEVTREKHESVTETADSLIKEEIISTTEKVEELITEQKIIRSVEEKRPDSQASVELSESEKQITTTLSEKEIIKITTASTIVPTEKVEKVAEGLIKSLQIDRPDSAQLSMTDPLTVLSKVSDISSKDDLEMCDVSSPPSNMSSGQVSCAPNVWDEHFTDEEDIPGSPTSVTSQVHEFSQEHEISDSPYIKGDEASSLMTTSFYGSLPKDSDSSKSSPVPIPTTKEQSYSEYGSGISTEHAFTNGSKPTSSQDKKDDSIASWGKPLGLPSPAPPIIDQSKTTPKKERKTPASSILAAKNKINSERKRSESPGKLKKVQPVYLDLTYVPHHGNANYCYVDFFKRIRARYYVFSGTEPSREVYNALLEAKQTWEDKDLGKFVF